VASCGPARETSTKAIAIPISDGAATLRTPKRSISQPTRGAVATVPRVMKLMPRVISPRVQPKASDSGFTKRPKV